MQFDNVSVVMVTTAELCNLIKGSTAEINQFMKVHYYVIFNLTMESAAVFVTKCFGGGGQSNLKFKF